MEQSYSGVGGGGGGREEKRGVEWSVVAEWLEARRTGEEEKKTKKRWGRKYTREEKLGEAKEGEWNENWTPRNNEKRMKGKWKGRERGKKRNEGRQPEEERREGEGVKRGEKGEEK